MNTCT